jgi:hypothetical protein
VARGGGPQGGLLGEQLLFFFISYLFTQDTNKLFETPPKQLGFASQSFCGSLAKGSNNGTLLLIAADTIVRALNNVRACRLYTVDCRAA